ncbi:MAG TPA: hypothetical protein VN048_06570 [Verrucomicrobiae bacterium]|jgi:hypothetical protein|nr:hypothetical protein [Verrucomicrobiae bacterium]
MQDAAAGWKIKKAGPMSDVAGIKPAKIRSELKASCGACRDGGNACFPYDACLALPGLATRTLENKRLPTPELT